jgi:hypothetical protein
MTYRRAEALTKSDTAVLGEPAQGLYIGGAGNVAVHMCGDPAGVYRTFAVTAGQILDVAVDMLRSTSTTATGVLALRRGEPVGLLDLTISGALPTAEVKDAPSAGATFAGSGGLQPFAFSVFAGALPTGMTLNAATGAYAGTPTVAQTKTGVVIRVTDANGDTADAAPATIVVAP